MSSPLISVLVITYNHARFIRETIESVVAQDYPALEVVVADDGSTDGTDAVIAQLAIEHPNRVIPIIGEQNVGIARNANRGLSRCRGEFIAILGGDDIFLPHKLSAQAEWFRADPRRVLSGTDAYIFESTTGVNSRRYSDLSRWSEGSGPEEFLAQGCPYLPSSVVVRRSAIPSYGFDVRTPVVADGKLFVDALVGGGIYGHLPQVFVRYRRHSNNLTAVAGDSIYADGFALLALIEAQHPHLVGACRRGRARLHWSRGVAALRRGQQKEARTFLRNALLTCPEYSWKVPAWYALSALPASFRDAVVARAKRRVQV